jgi:dextranase
VRYQEVIGPQTRDASKSFEGKIRIAGVSTDPEALYDKVWPIVRQGEGLTAISLINLLDLESGEWKHPLNSAPTPLVEMRLQIIDTPQPVKDVWWASPDSEDFSPQRLAFKQENGSIFISVPSLVFWDLLVIEWG